MKEYKKRIRRFVRDLILNVLGGIITALILKLLGL